jgi:hypothetical protein
MHKLRFGVVTKVEVSEERVLSKVVRDLIPVFLERLLVQMVSHANSSADNEIHLEDFFLLVIDDVLVLLLAKVSGLQPEGNIVEELAILVLLGVEEETEVVEDVIEEIVDNNSTLNAAREGINELIVFLNLAQSVVGPVILEMLVNLPVERVGQGLVLSKASEKSHPVVQLESLFFNSQVLVES